MGGVGGEADVLELDLGAAVARPGHDVAVSGVSRRMAFLKSRNRLWPACWMVMVRGSRGVSA